MAATSVLLMAGSSVVVVVVVGEAREKGAENATMMTSTRLIRGKFFFSRREEEDILTEKVDKVLEQEKEEVQWSYFQRRLLGCSRGVRERERRGLCVVSNQSSTRQGKELSRQRR